MNALEKTVDLLFTITILFLLPILYYGGGQRVSEAMLAGQAVEHFLKCVSTAGEITLPVWRELEHALEVIGCEEVHVKRERSLFEPYGEAGEIAEFCYVKETEAIRKQMEETGKFGLQAGDGLWVTVVVNQVPALYYENIRTGGSTP